MKHQLAVTTKEAQLETWIDSIGAPDLLGSLAELLPSTAVFGVDADRNIVFWSSGAESLLGFQRAEVLGQHCLKANRCVQCVAGCGIAQHGEVSAVPLVLHSATDEPIRLLKYAKAFFDNGEFAGGIEVLVPQTGSGDEPAAEAPHTQTFHGLTSADPVMHQVFQTCRNVAETSANALVRGESGTGKELIARSLHAESARAAGPFVAVNCASLTPSLMESELFGHVKGAFTGAVKDRDGIFQQADSGTLFLDEVAELPLELQAKLLRVLEEHAVTPVGGARQMPVDVRLVAATHRSLRKEVELGRFRADLMYRLRVVPIFLPALRERRGDVDLLVRTFIRERNAVGPRLVNSVAPEAMRALLEHNWPGNVRELRNVIEYAFAVGRGPEIERSELPPELRVDQPTTLENQPIDEATRIRMALAAADGHLGRAAAILGWSRATLWRKRKKHEADQD